MRPMTKSQLTQQTQTLTGLAQIPADATPQQPWAPEIQGPPDPEAPQNQTGKNHPLIFHPGQYTGWTLGRLKKKKEPLDPEGTLSHQREVASATCTALKGSQN